MRTRTPLLVAAIVLLLCCLVALAAGVVLLRARMARAAEQPLVLITSPANNSQVWTDRLVPVLMSARSENGIARAELWVDGHLWDSRTVEDERPTTYSAALLWDPREAGAHSLVVRVFDAAGNVGQATVMVQVVDDVPAGDPPVPPPSADEGGPGYSADPGDGTPDGGEEDTTGGEEEPLPAEEAPDPDPDGPADDVIDLGAEEAQTITLTLEAVGLSASSDFHRVNCYVTMAYTETEQVVFDHIPAGLFHWSPAVTSTVSFPWPADQALPVRVECTGVSPPATAIPLGEPSEDEVPPEAWDGRLLHLEWPADYDFVYRIQFGAAMASEDIPAPTNLRIEDVPLSTLHMLRWDWSGDEAQIDGFRLYLNGSLQWRVADPGARFTYLPPEWIEPPCGQLFHFQVTAYQGPMPGAESLPGELAPLEPDPGRCEGIYRITFEEIEFAPLDYSIALPDTADDDGYAGPLYGWFFVNLATLPFDTVQSDGIGVAGIRVHGGEHFDLPTTLFGEDYRYHRNSVVLQYDTLWAMTLVHGMLVDYDWGETDDTDDMLCDGGDVAAGPPVLGSHVMTCFASDGVTEVAYITYTVEELAEWPEGEPPPGAITGVPRPDLMVMWWDLSPAGELAIFAVNAGTAAAVPDLVLGIELGGAPLGTYTVPSGLLLEEWNGWATAFTIPDHTFASRAELCDLQVTADPADAYLEYDEGNNVTTAADLDDAQIWLVSRPTLTTAQLSAWVNYASCHGDPVAIRTIPTVGGTQAPDFNVGMPAVPYGSSSPVIDVEYTGAAPLTTDGWRIELVDLGTSAVFLSVDMDGTEDWIP